MPAGQQNTSDDAVRAVRRDQAMTLRLSGASYQAIGDHLHVSKRTAYLDVQEALAELDAMTQEKAEKYRHMELLRLDRLQMGVWNDAIAGNTRAVASAIKIFERRAKLLGLDAPTVVRHDLSKLTTEELQQLEVLLVKLEGERTE